MAAMNSISSAEELAGRIVVVQVEGGVQDDQQADAGDQQRRTSAPGRRAASRFSPIDGTQSVCGSSVWPASACASQATAAPASAAQHRVSPAAATGPGARGYRIVAAALQYISYYHPADFIAHLARAYEREQSPAAKDAIAQILTNSRCAPPATARSARTPASSTCS
jgi:hypothetical protein